MVYGVYSDKLEDLLEGNDWEEVKKDVHLMSELVARTKPQPEVAGAQGPLLECLAFPEETKLRYMQLLHQFYKDVFTYWKERLRMESEQATLHYEALLWPIPSASLGILTKMSLRCMMNRRLFISASFRRWAIIFLISGRRLEGSDG